MVPITVATATLTATGQSLSLNVRVAEAYRIDISGFFAGLIEFQLSQDGGESWMPTPALNMQDQSRNTEVMAFPSGNAAFGSWMIVAPDNGILRVSAIDWTYGTAVLNVIDLNDRPSIRKLSKPRPRFML